MREVGGDADLTQKSLAADGGCEFRVHDLEGDRAAVTYVHGAVNCRHASGAYWFLDGVAPRERLYELGMRHQHNSMIWRDMLAMRRLSFSCGRSTTIAAKPLRRTAHRLQALVSHQRYAPRASCARLVHCQRPAAMLAGNR